MARFVECSKPSGELEYEGEVAGGKLFSAEDGEMYCHLMNGGQEIWMIGLDL